MKTSRCPYHVKHGVLNADGKFIISDICGLKTACAGPCPLVPFSDNSYRACHRYLDFTKGIDRQTLVPKNDIEYLTETNMIEGFSENDLL